MLYLYLFESLSLHGCLQLLNNINYAACNVSQLLATVTNRSSLVFRWLNMVIILYYRVVIFTVYQFRFFSTKLYLAITIYSTQNFRHFATAFS